MHIRHGEHDCARPTQRTKPSFGEFIPGMVGQVAVKVRGARMAHSACVTARPGINRILAVPEKDTAGGT